MPELGRDPDAELCDFAAELEEDIVSTRRVKSLVRLVCGMWCFVFLEKRTWSGFVVSTCPVPDSRAALWIER
jgi:hypothetical protein